MARRRSRQKFPLIRVVLGLCLLTLAGLGMLQAWIFLKSERGQAWLLVALHQERSGKAQSLLTQELRSALGIVGATEHEQRPAVDSDALVRWNLEVPPTVSLTQANFVLTNAAREVGAEVLYATETQGESGDTLEMRMGLAGEATHRVVLYEPRRAGRPEKRAHLALVLESLGGEPEALLSGFLGLKLPLSFAVLPGDGAERRSIAMAAAGAEVLLYLPMEGRKFAGRKNAGSSVLVDMQPAQVRQRVVENLEEVRGAVGIVNYQGQMATQDPGVMGAVMAETKERGMFFVDANTSENSMAQAAAVRVGTPCLEHTVHLDQYGHSKVALRAALQAAGELALRGSAVVGMSALTPELLEVLREELPNLKAQGVLIVRASELARMGS